MGLSIISPVYNEEEVISGVVENWIKIVENNHIDDYEIVLCNDGSSDRTAEKLSKLSSKYKQLTICENVPNQGYGAGMKTALKNAAKEWVLTIDSDGQFDLEDGIKMYKADKGNAVFGYREQKKDTRFRVLANHILDHLINLLFRIKKKDPNCAMFLLPTGFFKSLKIHSNGFTFPTEVLLKAHQKNIEFKQFGIKHYKRDGGRSKLNTMKTIFSFLKFLMNMRFSARD